MYQADVVGALTMNLAILGRPGWIDVRRPPALEMQLGMRARPTPVAWAPDWTPGKGGIMGKTHAHGRQHPAPAHEPRRPRVIVAEDDPDVRQLVTVAFRGLGYDVVEASTGGELLDELGDGLLYGDPAGKPDVIISDIRMPGLTGMEILAGLRQAEWPTVIVLMTAFSDQGTREEAARLGVDAFFEKPFEIDDLMTAVVNMTTSAPRHRGRGKDRLH
jgi:CheY-like chemotaxis protein